MENRSNKYNRIIAAILMIFIALIIILNFLLYEKQFEITKEIIVCLLILVILCLAESFDNFSIPKIISLSKNVKEIKEDNEKLKEINFKLMEQMINIKNTNNQIMYMPGTLNTVGSSNIEDIKTKDNEEIEIENNVDVSSDEHRKNQADRYKYRRNLDLVLLQKVLKEETGEFRIQYDVKVTNNKSMEDNITKNQARFDALKIDDKNSIFYEIKISPFFIDFYYQLYYKLKVVEMYGKMNDTFSKLVVIIPNIDKKLEEFLGDRNKFKVLKERICDRFEPAINMGLLEIRQVNVFKEEIDEYINKRENNK